MKVLYYAVIQQSCHSPDVSLARIKVVPAERYGIVYCGLQLIEWLCPAFCLKKTTASPFALPESNH